MIGKVLARSAVTGLAVLAMASLSGGSMLASVSTVSDNSAVAAAPSDPKGNQGGNSGNVSGGQQGNSGSASGQQNKGSNGGGANTQPGPYTSSPSAPVAPSGNGASDNNQSQKPDAGTAGKSRADDKNPVGFVNGTAQGRGYECGNNQGIGQGNPAHSVDQCGNSGGDNPGDKPGDKPGDNPGDKPGDKPGDNTGDKPSDKPVDNPSGNGGGEGGNGGGSGVSNDNPAGAGPETALAMVTSAQIASGQEATSGLVQPEILGAQPLTPEELESLNGGASGLSGDSGMSAGMRYASPGTLPYTGEADELSTIPGLWGVAGLLLLTAGTMLRRTCQPVATDN